MSAIGDVVSRFRGPIRAYDGLLVAGMTLVFLLVLLGRSPITTALALAYLALFVCYVCYNGLRE